MTTTVTVSAHCGTSMEVVVTISTDDSGDGERIIMQDGETQQFYAYPPRIIWVEELPKS